MRLLAITLLSFCSVVPFLVIFHRFLELDDDIAGYLSFACAWVILPAILLKVWRSKPDLETLPFEPDDPILLEQMAISKSNIKRFINGLNAGKLEAFVKFQIHCEHHAEHIWGVAHSITNDSVIISLANEPIDSPNIKVNERMHINLSEIEDWLLVDSEGKTQGGYSMYAMALIYQRDYGKLPKRYAKDLANFVDFQWEQ